MDKHSKLRVREIAELSGIYEFWKVHWIGRTFINSKTGEMVFDVCLVPLTNPDIFPDFVTNPKMVYNRNFNFRERRIVQIGVGQLQLVRTGAVFYNGYPVAHPNYITQEFDITITEENQKLISKGDYWGSWGKTEKDIQTRYYIPANQYEVFFNKRKLVKNNDFDAAGRRQPYKSKCLVVDFLPEEKVEINLDEYPLNLRQWKKERGDNLKAYPEGTSKVYGMIIPCMELVRFYYTKSSQLCREMLFGGLDNNRIYDKELTINPDENGEGGFLMLAKYVRNKDVPVIARFVFDAYAMGQARHIYTSSFNNLNGSDNAALPEARFPFKNQSTRLKVHGTFLQSGNRIYFLVFWIESCTAQFPYKNIEFWRANPGKKKAPETKADVSQPENFVGDNDMGGGNVKTGDKDKTGRAGTTRNAQEIETQSEQTPSAIREKINLLLGESERFPDLENHSFNPRQPPKTGEREIGEDKIVSGIYGNNPDKTETVGTATGSGSLPITPASFIPDALPDDPDEIDDISEDDIYDKANEEDDSLPDLESFIKDEQPDDDEEISDDEWDNDFPVPNRNWKIGGQSLPIDLKVFRGILGWIKELQPTWKARMLVVPSEGQAVITKKASPYPKNGLENFKRPKIMPREVFIAEIKITEKRYFYLLDMEETFSLSGMSSRTFTLFLTREMPSSQKLPARVLRYILRKCEERNGKWLPPVHPEDAIMKGTPQYLKSKSFKHTKKTEKQYALEFIKTIKK